MLRAHVIRAVSNLNGKRKRKIYEAGACKVCCLFLLTDYPVIYQVLFFILMPMYTLTAVARKHVTFLIPSISKEQEDQKQRPLGKKRKLGRNVTCIVQIFK